MAMLRSFGLLVGLLVLVVKSADPTITSTPLSGTHGYEVTWIPGQPIGFMLTNDGVTGVHKLYRTANDGTTWVEPEQMINRDLCYVVKIITIPAEPLSLMFLGPAEIGCGWYTTDGGQNFLYVSNPGISFARATTNITSWVLGYTPAQKTWYTLDLGIHWYELNATYAAWGKDEGSIWLVRNGQLGFSYNLGDAFFPISDKMLDVYATSNFFYATAQNLSLLVGQDPENYQFAQFPFGNTVPKVWTVSDDVSGATWFFTDQSWFWGNVYTASGVTGAKYVQSLQHVLKRDDAFLDFHSVSGLPGVHLANVVTNYEDDRDLLLKTYITYDNGGEWSTLTPATGTICAQCSLNLYFNYKPGQRAYYTSKANVGLILATGYIGPTMSFNNPVGLGAFLSRDAGLTWTQLNPPVAGPYLYEFGANGAILLMAVQNVGVNSLYYSLDQGLTFSQIKLLWSNDVYITRIMTNSGGTSFKFVIFAENVGDRTGVVFGVDFSPVGIPNCGPTDYENWSPSDGDTSAGDCWLGQNVVYNRRLQASQCIPSPQTLTKSSICPCTEEDYECDFGYIPNNLGGTKLTCQVSGPLPPEPPLPCVGTYEQSSGFRLVPGDQCQSQTGLDLKPKILDCPVVPKTTTPSSRAWVPVVVIVVILVVLALIAFIIYRDPALKEKVLSAIGVSRAGRSYNRVNGRRDSALAGEEDFGIHDDLLEDGSEEDAKVLHDNDISKASSSRSDEFPRHEDDE